MGAIVRVRLATVVTGGSMSVACRRRRTLRRLEAGAGTGVAPPLRTRVTAAGRSGKDRTTRRRKRRRRRASTSPPSPRRRKTTRRGTRRAAVDATMMTTRLPVPLRLTRTPSAAPSQARRSNGSWTVQPQTCRVKRVVNNFCSSTMACLTECGNRENVAEIRLQEEKSGRKSRNTNNSLIRATKRRLSLSSLVLVVRVGTEPIGENLVFDVFAVDRASRHSQRAGSAKNLVATGE